MMKRLKYIICLLVVVVSTCWSVVSAQQLTLLEGEQLCYDYTDLSKASISNRSAVSVKNGLVTIGATSSFSRSFEVNPDYPLAVFHIRVVHTGHGDAGDYAKWTISPINCWKEYKPELGATDDFIAIVDVSNTPHGQFGFTGTASICYYDIHPSTIFFAVGGLEKTIKKTYCDGDSKIRLEVPSYYSTFRWYRKDNPSATVGTGRVLSLDPDMQGIYCCATTYDNQYACIDTIVYEIDASPCPPFLHKDTAVLKDTYTWRGKEYTEEGLYYDSLINQCNCDSVYSLLLRTQFDSLYYDSICPNETYIWREKDYSSPGEYIDSVLHPDGIDTIYHLILTHRGPFYSDEYLFICPDYPFQWHGKPFTTPGIYRDTIPSVFGCDSICILHLEAGYHSAANRTYSICPGETIRLHGKNYTSPGEFHDTIPNACGCDSVLTVTIVQDDCEDSPWPDHPLNPTVDCNDPTYSTTDTTFLYDSLLVHPFVWFEEEYTQPGVYSDTLVEGNHEGCDSIGRLLLRVIYKDSLYACGDEQVTFHTPWGDFDSQPDCDCLTGYPVRTLDGEWLVEANLCVARLETDTVREDTTLCYGTSIDWHGMTIDHTAEYEYHEPFLRLPSCDSIVYYLNAVIKDEPVNHPTTTSVCAGTSYTWVTYHDSIITAPGIYYDTLWTDHGCYSDTYILTLTHKSQSAGDTIATACDSFTWHGATYTESTNTPQWTTTNAAGCDSIVTLKLTIYKSGTGEETKTICDKQLPYTWKDKTCTAAGDYTFDTLTVHGCDSTITLHLIVNDHSEQDTTAYVCYEDMPFIWHNKEAQDGDTIKLTNSAGCDSIVTLHLFVSPQPKTEHHDSTICHGDMIDWHGQTIHTAGIYYDTARVTMGNGMLCDSIWYELSVTTQKSDTTKNNISICAGNSYTWQRNGKPDRIISEAGEYWDTVRYVQTDCDSMIYYLNLHVDDINRDSISATTCAGTPYLWRGRSLEVADVYRDTAKAKTAAECDTIYTLRLVVNQPTTGDTTAYVCEGEIFEWHGSEAADGAQITLTDASGCDSTVTLHLIKVPIPTLIVAADTMINKGDTASLWATGAEFYTWEPTAFVSKENAQYTGAFPTSSTTFTVTGYNEAGKNMLVNGDFELGNVGFNTTYKYYAPRTTNKFEYGKYTIGQWASDLWPTYQTATRPDFPGYNNSWFMVVDGSESPNAMLWEQTVEVKPNNDYALSCLLVSLLASHKNGNYALLQFYINGQPIGEIFHSPSVLHEWTQFYEVWNSGTATSATIQIINQNTDAAGNDFGLDNLSFVPLMHDCATTEQVTVLVAKPETEEHSICSDELPYSWHGRDLTVPGTYTDTILSASGFKDSIVTLHLIVLNCCPDTTMQRMELSICDTLMPYTWTTWRTNIINKVGSYADTLRNEDGCDSIIYTLNLDTFHCCAPLKAAIDVPDYICADAPSLPIDVKLISGECVSYSLHFTNPTRNKMPFRDTTIMIDTQYASEDTWTLDIPVPNDPNDSTHYVRPDDNYKVSLTLNDGCGNRVSFGDSIFSVYYPSWIMDQHWDDVIALLNDRYNGGYTFSNVEWLRDGDKLLGESNYYIYLPHELWTNPYHQHQSYFYQALLTRTDDGKTLPTCPLEPWHIDNTNVLTDPYVSVTPTLVPIENPVVHVMTNTEGTYWVYDPTGKLLQTADYEPCEHNVFDIQLRYHVQTMYILVFTPRNEKNPLQKKYSVVKVLVE